MKKCFKNKTRKIVTCFLALCMIAGMLPFAAFSASAEEETLATVDPISIYDLGLGMSYSLAATPQGVGQMPDYTPADRSAVLKFDVSFEKLNSSFYAGFYGWEYAALLLGSSNGATSYIDRGSANGRSATIGRNATDRYYAADPQTAFGNGRYSFEYGKLEVLTGPNAGKDKIYFKINGVEIVSDYTDELVTKPITYAWFWTDMSGVVLYDNIERGQQEETLAEAVPVSIDDLGLGSSYELAASGELNQSYIPTDPQGRSAIVKLCVDFTGDFRLSFIGWKGLWLAADCVRLRNDALSGKWVESYQTVSSGRHVVEFGKLAVLTGPNAGKDKLYVKLDGVEAVSYYTTDYLATPITNVWFYNGKSDRTEMLYTANDTLAEVEPISINDLGLGSSYTLAAGGNGLIQNYTPADTNARSEILKFNVDFTGDIRVGFQGWKECAWISSDCVRLENGSGGWLESYQTVASGRHSVELGKLAVLAGENYGKDKIYVKLDDAEVLSYYTSAYVNTPITYAWFFTSTENTVLYSNITAYAPYDEITVSDLTGKSSFTFDNTDTTFKYLPLVNNNSKVFRFNLVPAHSSGTAVQIGLNSWDQRLWIPNNGEFYLSCEGYQQQAFTWVKNQKYEIELGCKLATSGDYAGMDYVYIKVDGTLYQEAYTSHKTDFMNEVMFYGSGVTISDVDNIAERFDTYDVISLSDLGVSGNLTPAGEVNYTFDGVSPSGSRVFEFAFNHNQPNGAAGSQRETMTIGFNGWNRRMMTFTKTQIVLGSVEEGNREEFNDLNIAANTDHNIKYGNVRIKTGENAGKDLQFVYLDGKLVATKIDDPLPDDLRTVMIYAESGDGTSETLKNVSHSSYDYVNIDNEKNCYFVGKSIETPAFDGDGFVGWKCGGKLYPAGVEIAVSGNVELTSVSDLYFYMDENATARLYNGIDGLRFTSRLDTSDYATLEDFIAEKGTIIAPTSNFAEDGLFTLEGLPENTAGGLVRIVNNFTAEDDDDNYVWMGTLGNIKGVNLARDFAARGYIKVVYSDNTVKYFYTDVAKSSMYKAACDYYESSSNDKLKNKALTEYINTVADIVIDSDGVSVSENALGDYKGQTVTFTDSAITFSGTNNFKSAVINGVGMSIGDTFEVGGNYYSITAISGSVISLVEIQTPTLTANTYGYGVHWDEISGVTEYEINDSNDNRDSITFAAGASSLPEGVTYAGGVYTYVPTVVGRHDVSVTVTNAKGSAISHTVSAGEVKPVYAYWGTRNGLYYFTADNLTSVTGLTTDECQSETGEDQTLYIAYRTADGWSADVADRVGSDNNAERRAKDLANLKAMGANVIFLENGGGDFNADTTWSISRLKNIMDDAWALGMKVVVCDTVVFNASRTSTSQSDTNTLISNRLAVGSEAYNYMMHPAFYGWTFVDEPTYQTIDTSIRYTATALKAVAQANGINDYLFVAALQPAIGGRGAIFGSADEAERLTGYRDLEHAYPYYIKKYLEATGMNYFTFDSYTPYCAEDGSKTQTSIYNSYLNTYTWLTNLMNEPGLENVQIGQALTSFAYVENGLVPADVMFSAAAAMANGVDFISWFAYYPHYVYGDFGQTAVDIDGNPTSIYTAVQKATEAFVKMRPIISGFKTTSFSVDSNKRITTTVTDGNSTYHWYLNYNNTQGTAVNVNVSLTAGTQYYLFDAAANSYGTLNVQNATGNVTLAPGAAILVLG